MGQGRRLNWYRPRPRWPGRLAFAITVMIVLLLAMCVGAKSEQLRGEASIYSKPQAVACRNKPRFDPEKLTAAHKTLPCGTKVEVTNARNGKSVVVEITDRGPFKRGRIIDLSRAAGREIRISGIGPVLLRVIPKTDDLLTFGQRWDCVARYCDE